MVIRKYQESDCQNLTELFYNTVHSVNAKDYTAEQLYVWATGKIDLSEWNQSFLKHNTVVAVEHDVIVGFGDIDDTGYLTDCMFTRITRKKERQQPFVMYLKTMLIQIK